MSYWLFKTEPAEFSIDDLAAAKNGTTRWDGIRNYQARNILRDEIRAHDLAFIYHSQSRPNGLVGLARVLTDGYPDPAQFDPQSDYFDARSTPESPRWYCVDIQLHSRFDRLLPLQAIKECRELGDMVLLRQGRLSIQPVSAADAQRLLQLADSV